MVVRVAALVAWLTAACARKATRADFSPGPSQHPCCGRRAVDEFLKIVDATASRDAHAHRRGAHETSAPRPCAGGAVFLRYADVDLCVGERMSAAAAAVCGSNATAATTIDREYWRSLPVGPLGACAALYAIEAGAPCGAAGAAATCFFAPAAARPAARCVESQPIQDTFNLSVPERIFGGSLSSRRELGERIRTVQESWETSSI